MDNKYQYLQLGIQFGELVKATLGPKGMNKLVMHQSGPILTNDGATIIKNLKIDNPIGTMFRNLAESQEKAVGDGTTTSVLICAQLLENAINLLDKGMHRINIIKGYEMARHAAINYLDTTNTKPDKEQVMRTTFGSKISPKISDHLTKLILKANPENLRIYKQDNKDPMKSELINGFAFSGYTINDRVPNEATGRVAVLDLTTNMENAKMSVQTSEELEKVNKTFRRFKKSIVDKLQELDVKILFYTDTNPELESYLADAGIFSVVNYKRDELDNVCKATGATSISDPDIIDERHIGYAKAVYERDSRTIFVTDKRSKLKTLILKGSTKQVLDETERAVDDVLGVLRNLGPVVPGAGATEISLSLLLKKHAPKIGGKEQLAIEKFAEALEIIPLQLAKNCGLDATKILAGLKTLHEKGENVMGVDEIYEVSNALDRGVVEPIHLKKHAINSATDVANLILKLDDIYRGQDESE